MENSNNITSSTSSTDRFIPNRGQMNLETGNYILTKDKDTTNSSSTTSTSSSSSYRFNTETSDAKVLALKQKPPAAAAYHRTSTLATCNKLVSPNRKRSARQVNQFSETVLDAPNMTEDYYLNLLDWNSNNLLAVGLGNAVYVWNGSTGNATRVVESDQLITSVNWSARDNFLAVGVEDGNVSLWDINREKCLRTMSGHNSRVAALSWNNYILSSGSRSGNIFNHDTRVAQHLVGAYKGHSEEVCALRWSADGSQLASGGNDNLLNIWSSSSLNSSSPTFALQSHSAAVKALSWCPWQSNVLASGAGACDRHIRIWNTTTGLETKNVDTGAQVSAVLWSAEHRELISSHGSNQFQLNIWNYSNMSKVTELHGHTSRVLHMALSPDGTTVASASADETIRFWKCFTPLTSSKSHKSMDKAFSSSCNVTPAYVGATASANNNKAASLRGMIR